MEFEKGDLKQSFEQRVDRRKRDAEMVDPNVPDMIREDEPIVRIQPPTLGAGVDANAFADRWRREQINAQPQQDAFDQIDAQHAGLRPSFNRQSAEPLTDNFNRHNGNEMDAFDQIDANAARLERFNTHARGRERE